MSYNLKVPERILMGPGPSNVSPSVLEASGKPMIGHLDPDFIRIMDEVTIMLRKIFQTDNKLTFPVSATGSAGMETVCANLIEEKDNVLICINGIFGKRMADVAERCGANVYTVESRWGHIIEPEDVKKALEKAKFKMVGIVHAETSTGVWQPLEEISKIVHEAGALFVTDHVTALGGIPVEIDKLQIDAAYAGTQKCLSAPPGLSPVTFNEKALNVIRNRRKKVQSWYLDINMIANYWGGKERVYHHTAPISSIYALHRALSNILDEGLENVFNRHLTLGQALHKALESMGLKLFVEEEKYRLPELTSVYLPNNVDDKTVRMKLLNDFNIEIGPGLGEYAGKIWRIGLMGYTCNKNNLILFINALGLILNDLGYKCDIGLAVNSAYKHIITNLN
ncbi:MAG: alanine--glyoxylate aminotransferase family protein [Deferribacterota bacterium]|nr:alanine--glyoxylate aminotransferase family protein [Deferribacterota bacterium]